jgi:glycosyltransferase involved in cell wall biosynthesis
MVGAIINIIIPVCKVEDYLCKCVESVLSQTYKNIRVILVDDGSPDNCPKICDEFAKTDDRVTVIHQANAGLSAARNSGLRAIFSDRFKDKGEYVAFIDSDDYVEKDYIEFLLDLITTNNADIAQCGHYIVFSENNIVSKNSNHNTIIYDKIEALRSQCCNSMLDVTSWNKLYKIGLFKDVFFPEDKCYEDTATAYLLSEKADKIVVNMTPKYYYVQRYDSIANGTEFNENKYHFISVGDEFADYVSIHYPNLKKTANVKRVFVRLSTLSQMVNCNYYDKQRIKEIKQDVKKYAFDMLRESRVSLRDKYGVIALFFGFPVFRSIWKLYYYSVRKS